MLAGSPTSALTTSLALDLERRGFIVFIITSTAEDEQHVKSHSRVDILPLTLDLVYPETAQSQVASFGRLLSKRQLTVAGEVGHHTSLAGVILVLDTQCEVSPVVGVSPDAWSTALNAKVLNTILTAQHLLPLVSRLHSRILLLMPSIVSSLRPPHHAVQSTVSGALEGFAGSLASELALQNIPFCHFRLGHLELPGNGQKSRSGSKRVRGTPMRLLYESVFDALRSRRPRRTWRVGRGSLTYDLVGGWLPTGAVGWMMGLQQDKKDMIHADGDHLIESDGGSDSSTQWEKVEQIS